MEVNFFGAMNLHAAPPCPTCVRSRGADRSPSRASPGFTPLIARTGYAASKHALHGFFESLRSEVAPQGVDVTLVCPSFIATGIDRNALGAGRPAGDAMRRSSSAGACTPDDVADRIHAVPNGGSRLLLIGRTARTRRGG